ncbi:GNAT family N-acetyltransferase [Saliniramus sp.]|uniref:GNAT family N-acetyltransferase n=1 Tax=Saliniramus sp. TaxID=2986772 RepID=UPI002C7D69EC|nr:GNAT family N-acetyltransferase [Saliniramus sp.]HMB09197.1 GNAT family N-acetyltransferase [Saliniramus sp.]
MADTRNRDAWRRMAHADLPAVFALSKQVHAAYPEHPEIARERLALAPQWCRVLAAGADLRGYLLAHPWRRGAPPALDSLIGALPDDPDCLYIHDLAIAPQQRGKGDAAVLLASLKREAFADFPVIALISTGPATGYWQRQGFARCAIAQPEILASYDPQALYMEYPRP